MWIHSTSIRLSCTNVNKNNHSCQQLDCSLVCYWKGLDAWWKFVWYLYSSSLLIAWRVLASHIPVIALPSLFGMLVVGFLLRNVPYIDVAKHIDNQWSATLRSVALVVILIRSGLELDPIALKRLKFTCMRLAFGPCICEAVTVAIVVRYILDMPWLWGLQLG